MSEATGGEDSSPGRQLGGDYSWVSFLNCSYFFSLCFLLSTSFREPSFHFISSKERKSHHWKTFFFLRVVQYRLLTGACWLLVAHQLETPVGRGRLELSINPEAVGKGATEVTSGRGVKVCSPAGGIAG